MQNGTSNSKPVGERTILVTGASGFVATHIVRAFLEAGYKVRGTVRSEQTAAKVKKNHPEYTSQLSFSIVPDVQTPGGFDEAVQNIDGVIHTASPFQMFVENNERDLLNPAVHGTTEILKAVAAHAPQVQRVVITSSFAAISDLAKGPWPEHTYTEKDWNPVTWDEAKTGNGPTAYCASKTFAEKAAYDFVENQKPHFSISTICPPMIYGPVIQGVTSTSHLNTSAADVYRLMNGSSKDVPPTNFFAFCDVRDVAQAHLKAYQTPEAANERFFVTGGSYSYQEICDILRQIPEIKDKVPEGKPGSGIGMDVYKVDNSKSKKILGMTYASLDKAIRDTAMSLIDIEKVEKN